MSQNTKSNAPPEGIEHSEDQTSKAKSSDKQNQLELPPAFFEKAPSDPKRMLKEAKAKIGGAAKSYAEVGRWFAKVRRYGLWEESSRPKYKNFAAFYTDMGYTADQVCHQMAVSSILQRLLDRFSKKDVKITVFHATVLLSGVRSKESRFVADKELASEIFDAVLQVHRKVTGKLLREEMIERGLIQRSSADKSDSDASHTSSDESSETPSEAEFSDGMSLGEDQGSGNPGNSPAENSTSVAIPKEVHTELNQARKIATELIFEAEKSEENNNMRLQLIELRGLLEELSKQLGS